MSSPDTNRVLDKLEDMDTRQRKIEVAVEGIKVAVEATKGQEPRLAALELDKAHREGAATTEPTPPPSKRREIMVASAAGTGALGGIWAVLRDFFAAQ